MTRRDAPLVCAHVQPEGSIVDAYAKGCPENIKQEAVMQRQADIAAAEMPANPPPALYEALLHAIIVRARVDRWEGGRGGGRCKDADRRCN